MIGATKLASGLRLLLVKTLTLAILLLAGSDPANGTEKKMGSFLMMTCFLCTTISSGMFITAMAANPLAVNLATEALGQTISWGEAQPCSCLFWSFLLPEPGQTFCAT